MADAPSLPLDSPRIAGGVTALPGEFPHNVAIYPIHDPDAVYCGGTILSPLLVLTAAHCLEDLLPADIRIIAGEHDRTNRSGFEQVRLAKHLYTHENFTRNSPGGLVNDIGVIMLKSPFVVTDRVKPIELPKSDEEFEGKATIMGFGVVPELQEFRSDKLRKVDLPIVTEDECRQNYSSIQAEINDGMMCAGAPGKDSCDGDLGGSLVCTRSNSTDLVLCGISSWGYRCGSPVFPGVNTKVSKYIDWINNAETVMGDRLKCRSQEFACSKSGKCIARAYICNSISDCEDGEDEANCPNVVPASCKTDEFRCNDGDCVQNKFVCDFDNDCGDGSDESKCPEVDWTCTENEYQCGFAGRCIPAAYKCDGRVDCDDFSDERGCSGSGNQTTPVAAESFTTDLPVTSTQSLVTATEQSFTESTNSSAIIVDYRERE